VRRLLFCVPRAAALAATLAPNTGPEVPAGILGAPRMAPEDTEEPCEPWASQCHQWGPPAAASAPPVRNLAPPLVRCSPWGAPPLPPCLAAMQALLLHPRQHHAMQGMLETQQNNVSGLQSLGGLHPLQKGLAGGGGPSGWEGCLVPEDVWCQWVEGSSEASVGAQGSETAAPPM